MGNPVVRWQILSRNPEAATAFYTSLFHWSVNADNAFGFRQVDTGSPRGIPGGIWPIGEEGHPLTQLFVEVPDVAAAAAEAQRLGGRVIMPPQKLPDGDEMAIILDTEGLPVGLVRERTGS